MQTRLPSHSNNSSWHHGTLTQTQKCVFATRQLDQRVPQDQRVLQEIFAISHKQKFRTVIFEEEENDNEKIG